jgi:hypothetical protein
MQNRIGDIARHRDPLTDKEVVSRGERKEKRQERRREKMNRGYEWQDCSDLADTTLHNIPVIIPDRHLTHAG